MAGINAKTITLMLDILFVLVVLSGFLWGLKRGLKKSVNRLLLVIISIAVSLVLAGLITNGIFHLSLFKIDGATTINEYINNLANKYIGEGHYYTAEAILVLVKGVVNLISFVLVFIVVKFISWIVFLFIARDSKAKKAENAKLKEFGYKPKKYRWLGSLVGAIQGALIAFCLFIPISGISGVIADISSPQVSAKNNNTYEHSIVLDNVPKDYVGLVNVYENSVTNKMFGWLKLDNLLFNTLTSGSVDGVRISFRNEIVAVNNIYSSLKSSNLIDGGKEQISNEIIDLNETEFNSLTNDISNSITSSKLIRFALVDLSNYGASKFDVASRLKVKDINWEKENKIVSDSLSDIVYSVKPVVANIISGNKDKIVEVLSEEQIDFSKLGRGFDKAKNAALLKDIYNPAFQHLLSSAYVLDFGNSIGFDFSKINITSVVWEKEFGTVGKALTLANQLKDKSDLGDITGSDVKNILTSMSESQVGEEFDSLIANQLKEQFGIETSEDFSITKDSALIDSTANAVSALQNTNSGEALDETKSAELLNIVETMPENSNSEALFDAFAKEAGVENSADLNVADAKNVASLLNEFLNCNAENNVANATALATALDANPSCIMILRFKSNTYLVDSSKYQAIDDASNGMANKEQIMSLFTLKAE